MSLYNQCLAIARSKNPDIKMLENGIASII